MSIAASSRYATGNFSIPSLTTARAIASASISSDLPGSRGEQRPLEPPRDVAAVLDRPHPLLIQTARPAHRGQMSRLLGLDLAAAADPARARVDRRQRVPALVRVHPDHDHLPPSLRLVELPAKRISGGQLSLGAVATLLLVA